MLNTKKNNELNYFLILYLSFKKSKELEENIGILNICNFLTLILKQIKI
jgi:hypothetical protein